MKYGASFYLIYKTYKAFTSSEDIDEVLDKLSVRKLVKLLRGVLSRKERKRVEEEYTIDEALKEIRDEVKRYPSNLAKEGIKTAKEKVKFKMDKTESIPGLELKVPNPLNLLGGLVSGVFGWFRNRTDQDDQDDQDKLVFDLLKESRKLRDNEEIPDYIDEIIEEYTENLDDE